MPGTTPHVTIDIEKRTPEAEGTPEPAPPRPASLIQITPEMDDDEILRQLGYDPEVVKKAKGYTPGIFKKNVTSPDDASALNNPLGGIAQGAGDVAYGAVQLGARAGQKLGLLDPADVAFYEALNKLREADYQQNIRKGAKVDPETGEPTGMFADPSAWSVKPSPPRFLGWGQPRPEQDWLPEQAARHCGQARLERSLGLYSRC